MSNDDPPRSLLAMCSVAVWTPGFLGEKRTVNVLPQGSGTGVSGCTMTEKSLALAPENVIPETVNGAVPRFRMAKTRCE